MNAFEPKADPRHPGTRVWIALLCYYALVAPFLGYVPIWDSQEYLENYLFNPQTRLELDSLLLTYNGHLGVGYFWPFWIGQWLFPYQVLAVKIINLAIGSLAIVSFSRLAALVFAELATGWEITLLTIAFAVHPVFVAYALDESQDYGVLAYLLATIWLLLAGRLRWAAVTGLMLVFSKEPGLLLYTLAVVLFFAVAGNWRSWRDLWPLVLPYVGFAAYCLHRMWEQQPLFPWAKVWLKGISPWDLYFPNPFKADFKMACLGPFVLEFQWILTITILAGIIAGLFAPPAGPGILGRLRKFNRPMRYFGFLLIGCTYIESRFTGFTNQRYFLPLYSIIILCLLAALLQLGLGKRTRISLVCGLIALLVCCNFRTIDPVSKWITGTLPFGTHPMLSIATVRPDFGDLNRDELVYNLEHTYISFLLDDCFEKIRPTDQTAIVLQSDSWWLLSRLDGATFHRTEARGPGVVTLQVHSPETIRSSGTKPQVIYLLDLPYFHSSQNLSKLAPFYKVQEHWVFKRNGYSIGVFQMTLNPGA